jgi:Family of unknown function (DUF6399)/IclR helix-turn-helix domain
MGLWATGLRIFNAFCDNAKQSIRHVAQQTGFSKSSVHRLKQAMERRGHHPESWFWETEEGRRWLIRLVVATLYTFSLKRGVGAETIREFFVRLHLERHVGCSPSALRGLVDVLAQAILETAQAWEREGMAVGETRPIIGAVDETFLERMMLVFMDLVSGYLLFEEVAADRTYDTWPTLGKARLEALGVGVFYLVSDRAKALIKLAETGLDCLSLPDVFHLIHDLGKSYSLSLWSRLRQARQALCQAQERLATCQAAEPSGAEVLQAQALVAASEAEVKRWEGVHRAYRHHLEQLSLIVHPWCLWASTCQSSADVERQLRAEIAAIETLVETHALPGKKKALNKVRRQLADLSAVVDFWWQGVWQDLQQVAMTPMWKRWVDELLLPLMYWQEQVSRTRCPQRKARVRQALQAVAEAFEAHPMTQQLAPDVLAGWKAWAAEHARAFQRASSAVEGRNAYLSQMHHNHRGLPKRRSKVWTVLHNFDCRASDGTTPASRFFRRAFPDLFETVLSTIEDLPRPRQRHHALAISG